MKSFLKRVIFLSRNKSRYKKNFLGEMEILEKNGYDVTLKEYRSFFELCHQIFAIDHCYYHAHDFLAMALGMVLGIFKKYIFIKDYHQLLLPPIMEHAAEKAVNFYEQQETWTNTLTQRDDDRFKKILELVPDRVYRVLDAGCSTGEFASRLKKKLAGPAFIVGVDKSIAALRASDNGFAKVLVKINELSFKDEAFDLVVCAEILEHLGTQVIKEALGAVKKASRKYIIISVPNGENLYFSMCKCYNCGRKFHVNYHQRSFYLNKIKKIFLPEFRLVKYMLGGSERIYYNNFLLWIKQNIAGVWLHKNSTLCFFCGKPQRFQGMTERNAISWRCDKWNKKIREKIKSRQSHIIALYERR